MPDTSAPQSASLTTSGATGTLDTVSGPGPALAALFPNGTALELQNRDHSTAVGDRGHRAGVLDFLQKRA